MNQVETDKRMNTTDGRIETECAKYTKFCMEIANMAYLLRWIGCMLREIG
jgi:hypothetical protein